MRHSLQLLPLTSKTQLVLLQDFELIPTVLRFLTTGTVAWVIDSADTLAFTSGTSDQSLWYVQNVFPSKFRLSKLSKARFANYILQTPLIFEREHLSILNSQT
jgi:hypothetical protein